MRLKPGSLLRVYHNAITDSLYESAITDESILADSINRNGLDAETIGYWEALCEPYKVLQDVFEKMRGKELDPLNSDDLAYIHNRTNVDLADIMKIKAIQTSLTNINPTAKPGEILDKACALFREKWFVVLMEKIFQEHGVRIPVESVFSGHNRTVAREEKLCKCDLKNKLANERGCEFCDPVQTMFSSETIRMNRIGAKHGGKVWIIDSESNNLARKKIWDSYRLRREAMNNLYTLQHLKIVATFFHLLGFNSYLWDSDSHPKSIEDIWENYPTEDPVDLMARTIRSLLDNNEGWGRGGNYIDDQDRRKDLKTELRGTKIVTIYGEGGLGKTELVYQTLHESINDENQSLRYDLLLPFTFKGDEQGEYSITSNTYRADANQKGWQRIPSMKAMVYQISNHLEEDEKKFGDETKEDAWFGKAVEVLVRKNVWLIIDNHEIDRNEKDLDDLLDRFLNHPEIQQSNSRIIITTRVTPPDERKGRKIAMKSLNFDEMAKLGKKKANWYFRFNNEKATRFGKEHYDKPSLWEEASNFIQRRLRSKRHERVAGHPYVVFIAVYVHMFENPEGKSFGEILADLIEEFVQGTQHDGDGRLASLMSYIIEYSFNYMKTCQTVEDGTKHLEMTHLQRIQTENLEQIYGDGYRPYLAELVNLEILVESGEMDGEYVFRTENHRYQLQDFVIEKFGISHPATKWRWWTQSMDALKMNKRLSVASLRRLGIAEDTSANQVQDLASQLGLFNNHSEWTVYDVHACLNIVKHFGIVLSEIGEENQFLLAQANSSPENRLKLVKFIYDVVASGLENLAEYLARHDTDNKEPNLAMFREVLHFVNRVYNEKGQYNEKVQKFIVESGEWFPALESFDETERSTIGLGAIKTNLQHVLLQLLRNIPSPTKESLDSIRSLWKLGQSRVAVMSIPASELMKVGLAQVQLSGFDESMKILDFLGKYAQANEKRGRRIAASELELVYTGNFIREHKHLLEDDPNIVKCIKTIQSHVYVNSEAEQIPGQPSKYPLFNSEKITCFVEIQNHRLLVGKDINFQTNEITHHITPTADITALGRLQRYGTKHRVVAKVTRYSVEKNIHYSILDGIIEQEPVSNYPWEVAEEASSLRPIEDVKPEEMRRLLGMIKFDVTMSGALLFGALLKEVLSEHGIEHKGKIWKRWKTEHFPTEEGEPGRYKEIEHVIERTMKGAWIVERPGPGPEIRIRKIPSIITDDEDDVEFEPYEDEDDDVEFEPYENDDDIHDGEEVYVDHEERVRPSIDWDEIYPPGPSHATSGHEGRRDLKRTGKRKTRSRERPACMKCRSRIHLSGISAGELYCGQCDHVIDASNGRCVDAYCTMC